MRRISAAVLVVATLKKSAVERTGAEEALTQYGALCWREDAAGGIEVLLITSRDTGRWVIPKGWPMRGKSGAQCALQEAYEEAGVFGDVSAEPAGIYSYLKTFAPDLGRTCVVTAYPVAVRALSDAFPERKERERRWFPQAEAAELVAEPDLRNIIAGFVPPRGQSGRA